MSDEKSGPGGKRGFGPKKPRATFGDVMLGIPAGRAGERERGRLEERRRPAEKEAQRRGYREKSGSGQPPIEGRPVASSDHEGGIAPSSRAGEQSVPAESAPVAPRRGAEPEVSGERKQDRSAARAKSSDRKKKRALGPMVVVKRLTGAIETRPPKSAEEPPVEAAELSRAGDGQGQTGMDIPAGSVASRTPPTDPTASSEVADSGQKAAEEHSAAPAPSLEEAPEKGESFAELFEASTKHEGGITRRMPRVGDRVSGTIFQLGAETAFVTLTTKHEAMIELDELKDEEGILRFGVGDPVEAYVIEAGAKGIYLSKSLPKGMATLEMLADARSSGIPVEGLVLSVNKGGLEVAIGDIRAFCPVSQIDVRYIEKPDALVGEKHTFKVLEVRGKKVVVSRRALIEEELRARAAETRKSLSEGKVVRGKITHVRDFGAFVDLGGIEGLIPVSEISHARIARPSEVVKPGDEVEVEVLRIEPANPSSPDRARHKERITLSMRARQEDPWKVASAELKEGDRLQGKVVRLQPFGAFIELRPGIDGLIHISALSDRRIAHPKDVVKVGQEVSVLIEKIDLPEKKIGLRLVREEVEAPAPEVKEAPAPRETPPKLGQVVTGKIDRIEPYGVFLVFRGGQGLIPASETGTERGTDLKRHFQLGQELKAAVIEIDPSKRVKLSVTAAEKADERAAMDAWRQSQPKGGGGKGLGTFADLLKGKKLL